MYLMYIFISVPPVISHSFLSIIVVIVHEKYTLLDQRDRYNCWNVSASFEFTNPQIPMISWFMPTRHTVLLQKRYTKYVVFGVGMIRFRVHIHLKNIIVNVGKIYCNHFNYLFVNTKSSDIYDSGLRTRDRFIQHKITQWNITSGLHCKTILACWTNMDLT